MKQQQFYKDGDAYIGATGECPKGFKDAIFVVWEGSPANLTEGIRTADQLKKLEAVDTIPNAWGLAFRAKGFKWQEPHRGEPAPTWQEPHRGPTPRAVPLRRSRKLTFELSPEPGHWFYAAFAACGMLTMFIYIIMRIYALCS